MNIFFLYLQTSFFLWVVWYVAWEVGLLNRALGLINTMSHELVKARNKITLTTKFVTCIYYARLWNVSCNYKYCKSFILKRVHVHKKIIYINVNLFFHAI